MRVRHLLPASMMVLGLVAVTTPANAAVLDWEIDVEVNTVAQGTATSSSGTLIVSVFPGDTVRFIVGLSASTFLTSYQSALTADITEMTYLPTGSAQDNNLAGGSLNFAAFQDPNDELTDGTPGTGVINSLLGSSVSVDLYFVDFVVEPANNSDGLVDFSISGTISTTGGVDSASPGTASVRLDVSPIPEPASMLLLGSGLAGLAGFSRRRKRR